MQIPMQRFNPRSLHRERLGGCGFRTQLSMFQSTLPSQGATTEGGLKALDKNVSIHAPFTGSDYKAFALQGYYGVSIHAPFTGSDCKLHELDLAFNAFQSTLPSQGATLVVPS